MKTTKEWAKVHGISIEDCVPAVENYNKTYARSESEIAIRSIILFSVSAVGYGVDPIPVIDWLKDQNIWSAVSANEKDFLLKSGPTDKENSDARWKEEAVWALLWTINRIESLGLPIQKCDTDILVDQIMPALGDSIKHFVSTAKLRSPSDLLAEDDRIYNLHCYARQAYRENKLPKDLIYGVLFQRHYAFEWLSVFDDWDNIRTDT